MSKETNTFSIGDRVKTVTEVNSIPAGITGTITDELEVYDYQVKFDVSVHIEGRICYDTYAFYSHELEFIQSQENAVSDTTASARKLRGLTIKDLIAYYCQEMQITPEELIANFGNDFNNMNIMWGLGAGRRPAFAEISEDGQLVIGGKD